MAVNKLNVEQNFRRSDLDIDNTHACRKSCLDYITQLPHNNLDFPILHIPFFYQKRSFSFIRFSVGTIYFNRQDAALSKIFI